MNKPKYTWQQEKQMLEDAYARRLLIEYNIKEVTTQRQAKTVQENLNFLCQQLHLKLDILTINLKIN